MFANHKTLSFLKFYRFLTSFLLDCFLSCVLLKLKPFLVGNLKSHIELKIPQSFSLFEPSANLNSAQI